MEISGGILTDLHSGQVLPPKLNSNLSPGFGYFTFGKFGLGGFALSKEKLTNVRGKGQ